MKRVGYLIPRISSLDNLYLAYYKAKKGKAVKPEVRDFGKNLDAHLCEMRQQIASGEVSIGNYHYFTIYDPKERRICAAAFPERVLHHALMNVCHPFFESFQISDSYATRLDKGTFKAIDRAMRFQKQYAYYLKMDIRKYFDSIDHHILLQMLRRRFKDPILMSIFEKIIHSYVVSPGKGVPIGNLTSQYFANHYLALLDHFVKEALGAKAYVRYMDDIVFWHNDLGTLQEMEKRAAGLVYDRLKLSLKTNYINLSRHGLPFLGFRLFPHKKLLSPRSKKRFCSKLAVLDTQLETRDISQEKFQQQAAALFAFVEKAYTKRFRAKVLSPGIVPWQDYGQ